MLYYLYPRIQSMMSSDLFCVGVNFVDSKGRIVYEFIDTNNFSKSDPDILLFSNNQILQLFSVFENKKNYIKVNIFSDSARFIKSIYLDTLPDYFTNIQLITLIKTSDSGYLINISYIDKNSIKKNFNTYFIKFDLNMNFKWEYFFQDSVYHYYCNKILESENFYISYNIKTTLSKAYNFIYLFNKDGFLIDSIFLNLKSDYKYNDIIKLTNSDFIFIGQKSINKETQFLIQFKDLNFSTFNEITFKNDTLDKAINFLLKNKDGSYLIGGSYDKNMYIAKLNIPYNSLNNELELDNFEVFPLPSLNLLYFKDNNEIISVEIYSIMGEKICNLENISNYDNFRIFDIASLPNGMYLYKIVKSNNKIKTGKILILR